ncbi:MFS transporter [Companilactobacillus bobalius]|uniref:MFS family major facilitator transporter n=2 Tax=Companilactobacillus bobalius TaxID=2801451 RepID=A0A0R1KKF2_9LACO|nr:MFS transporter [Companilactobacillus bobalius]KAE9564310.1 hypothetical protein ATN92_01110 [Companilactobacillus bobalius]KRK84013.1 MFS family major facilitator transporter [Companilactobacillus bobalius DSM 19674]OVE97298.1 putative MFS-type transporter YwoG [Companilactobacillus bobalius]GEO58316.1 MFS transporter [Companilactobacillus paralimentarius]
MNNHESLFSRDFWLLALTNLFVMTGYYSLMVTVGLYSVKKFQAPTSISGLIVGITVIGILISRFSSGYLTHIFSNKQLMVAGTILLIPATLLYQMANSILFLIVVRLIQGIAIGLVSTVTNTAVVLLFPKARTGEGIGYFSLSTILATAVGPFAGLLVEQHFNFNVMFMMETILAILALIFCLFVNGSKIAFHFTNKHPKITIHDFIEPKALPIASTIFIVGLGYAAIQAYLSFYTTELNLASYSSVFFLIYAAAILISRPFTGRIIDHFGENAVIIPSAIINMLGMMLLAVASSGWMILVSAFLIGLGFGNFQSTCQTVAAKSVPIERLSQATATYFILFDLSLGVGPYALGIIEPLTGYRGLFCLMGITIIIGLIWYLLVHARKNKNFVKDIVPSSSDNKLD